MLPFRRNRREDAQAVGDELEQAAQEAGTHAPTATTNTTSTHIVWKLLFFPLWFQNIRYGLYVLGGILATGLIWYTIGWEPLLVGPAAAAFAWVWWKRHYHQETIILIEVRAEGQKFRPPQLPFPFKVTDSGFRIYILPRRVYDRALKYGTYQPIYEMPPDVVICDYADPVRNMILFNEDPEWTNFAIVAQLNQGLAKNLRRRGRKEDWLSQKEKEAFVAFKRGELSKETLESIFADVEQQLDIVRESAYTKRSFAHYYQDTIPRLKRQVIELLKGIEELSFAVAAELSHALYNQPMTPEVEQEVGFVKTKYGKLKLALLEEFDFSPEVYDHLGSNEYAPTTPELHALAQRANAGSGRNHNLDPETTSERIL